MKISAKLLAFILVGGIIATALAACSEKRILMIDDDTNAAMSSELSDVTSNDGDAVEPSSTVNSTYGDETMPDDIYASPDTIIYETTEGIYVEEVECVSIDGLTMQYFNFRAKPESGLRKYLIVNSYRSYDSVKMDVIIPESVEYHGNVEGISNNAFRGTKITSIKIPKTIMTIGDAAFENCNDLEKVYYQGNEDEWALIDIDGRNALLLEATRYYYSDTEPAEEGNYWHYVDGVPTIW